MEKTSAISLAVWANNCKGEIRSQTLTPRCSSLFQWLHWQKSIRVCYFLKVIQKCVDFMFVTKRGWQGLAVDVDVVYWASFFSSTAPFSRPASESAEDDTYSLLRDQPDTNLPPPPSCLTGPFADMKLSQTHTSKLLQVHLQLNQFSLLHQFFIPTQLQLAPSSILLLQWNQT